MKLFAFACFNFAVLANIAPRRYVDLEGMLSTNDNLELNMLWGYGCHCFTFNDRPLSTMGAGQPRDPLDRHCKEYKECQRCARDRFGDECVPEIVKYEWKNSTSTTSSVDHLQCGDSPSTCERALCECDKESFENCQFYRLLEKFEQVENSKRHFPQL